MDENRIIPYIEPIFRFCCRRLSNRYDAEDLAGEIICHVLDGMSRYKIESFDAWVWRIAHNRYARLIDAGNKNRIVLSGEEEMFDIADDSEAERDSAEREYEAVFRCLHTLSSEYRNIFVDYYIGELPIKKLVRKYSLPETTIKWRLNAGRQKIRSRIGEDKVDNIYRRINWNTTTCNGNMDSDAYLHTQIARSICLAAYERPLTIEEISVSTGIPAMYIEDELPRLEYGDAICKIGGKYAANFILFRLKDRKRTEGVSLPIVKAIADKLEQTLNDAEDKIPGIDFYGNHFGIERLGYMMIPYLLRRKIRDIKINRLHLENGPYPPRKDGGCGWFIVEETVDENENCSEYSSGCNVVGDDSGSEWRIPSHIYYYWIGKYFDSRVSRGTRWMNANGISQRAEKGVISKDLLSEEDAADLICSNLALKSEDGYRLNFSCFTDAQFKEFTSLFDFRDGSIDASLAEWIMTVRRNFEEFVPVRLHDQINQWIGGYANQMIGYVIDELIVRGFLRKPDHEKPLTDSVFYVEGKYINP